MMRWRPDEGPDKRLLIVTVTPEDIKYQKEMGWEIGGESLSDQAIIKVLEKLNTYKPLVIGLDIFRDFPAKDEHLKTQLAQNKSLIAVCKIKEEKNNSIGIEPPPEIQENNEQVLLIFLKTLVALFDVSCWGCQFLKTPFVQVILLV